MNQDNRPSFLMILLPTVQPDPPLRAWYTGLCHLYFNLGAQQTAGGSLEDLQIQKRVLSSCRWETWWGLFKAATLEPLPGANSPSPALGYVSWYQSPQAAPSGIPQQGLQLPAAASLSPGCGERIRLIPGLREGAERDWSGINWKVYSVQHWNKKAHSES